MHTPPSVLPAHPLRAFSTSTALLLAALAIPSCAAPQDTTGSAAEAELLTVLPRTSIAEAEAIERFVQDNVPRFRVYASGRDFYYGTSGPDQGVAERYSTPQDLEVSSGFRSTVRFRHLFDPVLRKKRDEEQFNALQRRRRRDLRQRPDHRTLPLGGGVVARAGPSYRLEDLQDSLRWDRRVAHSPVLSGFDPSVRFRGASCPGLTAPAPVSGFGSKPDSTDLDAFCQIVIVPAGGETKPETWRYLSAVRLWMEGDAYLTKDLGLSALDVVGIALALEAARPEPPLLPGVSSTADTLDDEEGGGLGTPPQPPDGRGDDHTWTGGPPSHGSAPSPASGGRPGGHAPPGPHTGWPSRPTQNGSAAQDALNGVGPDDRPVGKYPGWDKPHAPRETWQVFRCRGVVYEGYKSDCPDFQGVPLGERWVMPFDELVQQIAKNARHNLALVKTDPSCLTVCHVAMVVPTVLLGLCARAPVVRAAPNVWAQAFGLVCVVAKSVPGIVAAGASSTLGAGWCEKSFCMPPSGSAKE